jgi:hypothetical protein
MLGEYYVYERNRDQTFKYHGRVKVTKTEPYPSDYKMLNLYKLYITNVDCDDSFDFASANINSKPLQIFFEDYLGMSKVRFLVKVPRSIRPSISRHFSQSVSRTRGGKKRRSTKSKKRGKSSRVK